MATSCTSLARRQPLADTTSNRINERVPSKQTHNRQRESRSSSVPCHESLRPGGNLLHSPLKTPENKRLSTVVDEVLNEQKRLSTGSASSAGSGSARKLKVRIGPWQLGKSLGRGMSARVRKARHVDTGLEAAVKIINLRASAMLRTASILAIDQQMRSDGMPQDRIPMVLQREITILKAIEHPNVIKIYDVWENRGDLYLFMELVDGGELFEFIQQYDLDESEVVRIFRQLLSGLQYCHRFRLCHRDLKPENILMDKYGNIKIADFGMAAMHNDQPLSTACGSPHYAAPEVCQGKEYFGDMADIWSCGIVLYVMIFKRMPFGNDYDVGVNSHTIKKIIDEVQYKKLKFPPDTEISKDAKDLLKRILHKDPHRRITISEIWNHPLLVAYKDFAALPQNRDTWLGGPLNALTDEDCGEQIRDIRDIDRAIIKGLCTLWQTKDEHRFVRAVLEPAPSYEKVLYNSLRKYRLDQEENFRASSLVPSSSDYHHIAPKHVRRSHTRTSLLGPGSTGKHSQYSIIQPSSRRPSTQSRRTGSDTATETTYDPYRSSKPQVIYRGDSYTKIDVHRGTSSILRHPSRYSRARSGHHPASSVWESTVGSSSMASLPSSPPGVPHDVNGHLKTLRHTAAKRVYSVSSLASSNVSRSSFISVQFRKTASYKRNVSFKRLKPQPPRPTTPGPMSLQQGYLHENGENSPSAKATLDLRGISCAKSMPHMTPVHNDLAPDHSHKTSRTVRSNIGVRNSYLSQEAAVRASNELSRFCDEAFTPSPISIMTATPGLSSPSPNPQNAALAARLRSANSATHASRQSNTAGSVPEDYRDRPLPEPPMREPYALQMQRELSKMLKRLKEQERELEPGTLDTAMAEVERLMRVNAPKITEANYERRVASAPTPEVSRHEKDGSLLARGATDSGVHLVDQHGRRYFSDPLPQRLLDDKAARTLYQGPTVRLVQPSPAQIRGSEDSSSILVGSGVALEPDERFDEPRIIPRRRDSREFGNMQDTVNSRHSGTMSVMEARLHTIEEDRDNEHDEDGQSKRGSGGSKLKSWFRRSNGSSKSLEKEPKAKEKQLPAPPPQNALSQAVYEDQSKVPVVPSPYFFAREPTSAETWHDHFHQPTIPTMPAAATSSASRVALSYQAPTTESEFPSRDEGQWANSSRTSGGRGFFASLFKRGSGSGSGSSRDKRISMTLLEPSETSSLAASSLGSQRQSAINSSTLSFGNTRLPVKNENPYPTLLRGNGLGVPVAAGLAAEPRNWLARLLQVKPAIKVLAFDAGRTRMLREIRGILREWRRYGVRDIVLDRNTARVWARLGERNGLGVKPVEIVIELFQVVYTAERKNYGRSRAEEKAGPIASGGGDIVGGNGGMSVARMEQVRGAKSSFEKCVAEIENVCRKNGQLMLDKTRAKAMKRCLKELRR